MKAASSSTSIGSACLVLLVLAGTACSPKVQVQAPTEPIVINMNVKIEHEIRVKVDKDLDDVFADDTLF